MKESLHAHLKTLFRAKAVREKELIQKLWSGYGRLSRMELEGSHLETIIVKNIQKTGGEAHPRGWNTERSHLRKQKSYEVEVEWYKSWAKQCDQWCKVPKCYDSINRNEELFIILEDLNAAGFPIQKSSLNKAEVHLGLSWLANFHATFLNVTPIGLWPVGTYWHLSTRPDELAALDEGKLKELAPQLDKMLSDCQFLTLVHGDAKVANFCFAQDFKRVAAVDFQYVGGGCGMKDVIYFLGSCLNEAECEALEEELIDYYFQQLESALISKQIKVEFSALEKEWRKMYAIAWADFIRFLKGWMPAHHKINDYSERMVERAIRSM